MKRGDVTIGQLARITGVSAKTIRYYEAVGVLPAPARTPAGYRRYDESAAERVRFVRGARALGLPLRELKSLIATLVGTERPALRPRLLAIVRAQLAAVRDRSEELHTIEQHLEEAERRLRHGRAMARPGRCRCLEIDGAASR